MKKDTIRRLIGFGAAMAIFSFLSLNFFYFKRDGMAVGFSGIKSIGIFTELGFILGDSIEPFIVIGMFLIIFLSAIGIIILSIKASHKVLTYGTLFLSFLMLIIPISMKAIVKQQIKMQTEIYGGNPDYIFKETFGIGAGFYAIIILGTGLFFVALTGKRLKIEDE